jgi:hypothetical protein
VPSVRPLLEMSNRGKRDTAIDIATPQGLEIPARPVWPDLCRHIGRTDLIDDYRVRRPGVAASASSGMHHRSRGNLCD